MLVSTHNLGSVPDFCDQVVLINRTVLAAGPTAEVFTQKNLERAFGGVLRNFQLGGRDLHDDDDARSVTVLTDDERPLVFYGDKPRAARRHQTRAATMSELLTELMVPFGYNYMLKAMWVSALVGGVCAFLSAYLMLKGWSLMGDALAHSIVPGVAGAYIIGAPFAVGAFFAGIVASLAMQFVKQKSRLREDAVIGLVFTALFALGLLMASIWPTSVSDPDHRARQHPRHLGRGRGAGRGHRRGLARDPGADLEGSDGHLLRREPRALDRHQDRRC